MPKPAYKVKDLQAAYDVAAIRLRANFDRNAAVMGKEWAAMHAHRLSEDLQHLNAARRVLDYNRLHQGGIVLHPVQIRCADRYLSYVNDFVTDEAWAAYYGIDPGAVAYDISNGLVYQEARALAIAAGVKPEALKA